MLAHEVIHVFELPLRRPAGVARSATATGDRARRRTSRRSPRRDGSARTSDRDAGRSSCCTAWACSTRDTRSTDSRTAGGASDAGAAAYALSIAWPASWRRIFRHAGVVAAFDLEHLRELELREAWMREVERNRDARHAVRREPLVRQPVVRAEDCTPRASSSALTVAMRCSSSVPSIVDAEIAHADLEQLLVGQRRPVGGRQRS